MLSFDPGTSIAITGTFTFIKVESYIDGEASVMMMVMISSNSPSRQGARTKFLVPNRGFWWWKRNRTLSGKTSNPPLFLGQRAYVGEEGDLGGARGGHTTPRSGLA